MMSQPAANGVGRTSLWSDKPIKDCKVFWQPLPKVERNYLCHFVLIAQYLKPSIKKRD